MKKPSRRDAGIAAAAVSAAAPISLTLDRTPGDLREREYKSALVG
ncbi:MULTISPECIES: hypothetical protein [Bradyrhizobium]|nr:MULTISPECIES: hypothetical protein [unclassified Bradyrhizobium]